MTASLVEPTSRAWLNALTRVPSHVYHLPEYVSFDAQVVGGLPRAFLFEQDGDLFLLPLVLREVPGYDLWDAVSPYGYPGPVSNSDSPEFWRRAVSALGDVLRELGLVSVFVRLDPLTGVPLDELARAGTLVRHGRTVSIDLRLPPERWWTQVRKDHRKAINRSARLGHTSVIDDWTYLSAFQSIYEETMERVGASKDYFFDLHYFESLRAAIGQHVHLIIILARDREPISGTVLLASRGVLQAHLGGSRTARMNEEADRLTMGEVVRWGRANNYHTFHLGGGVGGREDSVFSFKKGFSTSYHPFFTLRMVLRPATYRDLVARTAPTANPEDSTGYFPGYRVVPAASLNSVGDSPGDAAHPTLTSATTGSTDAQKGRLM